MTAWRRRSGELLDSCCERNVESLLLGRLRKIDKRHAKAETTRRLNER